jgi:diguanylate cyclase
MKALRPLTGRFSALPRGASPLFGSLSTSLWLLLGAAAAQLLWLALSWNRQADHLLFAHLVHLAPSLIAAPVVFAAAFGHRGKLRRGWLLVAVGLLLQAVGNGLWCYLAFVPGGPPLPPIANLFTLLCTPFLAAGLVYLLPTPRRRSEKLRLALDFAIIVGAVMLFLWRFLLAPLLTASGTPWVMLVSLAYPLLDLLLLGLLFLLLREQREGRGRAEFALLGLGVVVQVMGNSFFSTAILNGNYGAGHPLSALWTSSTVLLALAARSSLVPQTARAEPVPNGYTSVLAPYIAVALGLALLLATELDPAVRDTPAGRGVLYGAVLVTFVVVLRQLLAFYENWRLTARLAEHSRELKGLYDTVEARVRERTAELEALSERFRHDALHDALTGLPNRTHFRERLRASAERGRPFGVLYLDFDRFKEINDNFGHAVGDALLIAIGARLAGLTRSADLVARLGGDEFAVFLQDLSGAADAAEIAERLVRAFALPLRVNAHTLTCTVSIGVVLGAGAASEDDDPLRDADIAMYRAKALGKSCFVVFEPAMREAIQSRLTLEAELRVAAANGCLVVHYQPVVRTADGSVAGFEALVRWPHPQRGLLAPAEFVPLAEESGLVAEIDRWVLRAACHQVGRWDALSPGLAVGVNVSSGQFAQADFPDFVAEVLAQTGLAPQRLKLELTESLLIDPTPAVQRTLGALKALGVRLHIDDFGTGYSSLAYLQSFDADVLKVDRSFVQKMFETEASAELVRTIVLMAHNLGMKVVAEGVETEAQFARLRALGCEYAQGFLFSPPLPEAAVPLFLAHRSLVVA